MREIERRVASLERAMADGEGVTLIAIQGSSAAKGASAGLFCEIDGITHTCGVHELPAAFENRMRAVACDLNRRLGRPTRIICGAEDMSL